MSDAPSGPAASARPSQGRPERTAAWLLTLAFLALAVRLGHFVDRYAVNIVFWDQWDYLQGLFDGADAWTLFRWQHGPHRQGLGNLLIAALYKATGWNGRADAAAAAVLLLAAALGALWLVRRLCGPLRAWDVVVALLFLSTVNAETYAGTINLAHGPLPALYLVAYGLALTVRPHAWRCALVVGLNFLCVSGGFTLMLGGVTPVLLLVLACGPGPAPRERALYGAGVLACAGTLALFFHGYSFQPAVNCFQFPHSRPLEYLPFTGFVLARPFGLQAGTAPWRLALGVGVGLGMTGLGAYATLQVLRSRGASALWSVVCALVGFAVLFAFNGAVGRVCTGMEAASASRYVPYVLPGVLAVYLVLRSQPAAGRAQQVLLSLFLTACLLKEVVPTASVEEARTYSSLKRRWRDCYLRHHDIARCDVEAGHPIYPEPAATRLQEKLDWLEARGYSFFQAR